LFEHIGRDHDEDAPRRRAQSIGLLGLLVGAAGFCAGILTLVVVDDIAPALEPEPIPIAFVEVPQPALEAPPPAPPIRRGQASEPDPAEAPADSLPEPIDRMLRPAFAPQGDPKGSAEGQDDGSVDGTGPPGGCDDCSGAGPILLHHSELVVVHRVLPRYPRRPPIAQARCIADLEIASTGRVVAVTVRDCPPAFHPATETALSQWRFEPVTREDGVAVEARSRIAVSFRR